MSSSEGADLYVSSNISTAQITVVTYGLLRHPGCRLVKEALMAQGFHVVIADESHYIKSRKAAGTKFLVPLLQAARRKILLTGTPALARPEEVKLVISVVPLDSFLNLSAFSCQLFPQLQALDPKRFSNWSWFAKKFCDAHIERFGNRTRFVTRYIRLIPNWTVRSMSCFTGLIHWDFLLDSYEVVSAILRSCTLSWHLLWWFAGWRLPS